MSEGNIINKILFAGIAVIIAIVLTICGVWYFTNSTATGIEKLEIINIEKMPIEAHALIYIAQERGF